MSRRTTTALLTAACAASAAAPAAADAAFFPGEPIDGPSADIVSMGDLDVARDGGGAVAYVRREGGVDHIFVSRLERGVWTAPERVDQGLDAAGSQPVVAAADNGRVAVAFVNGGSLYAVTRAVGAPGFSPPAIIATGASNPSIDMSINGAVYLSFTAPGASAADVRVAHLDRDQTQFTVLGDILDVDPARDAGDGTKRSQVAISADGTGLVVWGEAGADGRSHVYGRRVFGLRISSAPQDLTLPDLEGRPGRDADLPALDIEDDSSYAWVAFRQSFQDGIGQVPRTIARRLVGSQFETPATVDGGIASGTPQVELSGRGEGIVTAGGVDGAAIAAPVHDDKIFPAARFDGGNGVQARPVPTFPETGDGLVAWLQGVPGAAQVRARAWDIDPAKRDVPPPAPEVPLSDPALGPVDPAAGFDAASNRAGDVVALFVQGTGGERRLMSGGFDRVPGAFRVNTTSKYRRFGRPPISWSPSFELWGPVTYRVEIDGAPVGETQDTKLTPAARVADGLHRVRVVATDRRGQSVATPTRNLRVDATKPTVAFRVSGTRKAGRLLKLRITAGDVRTPAGASGLRFVRVDFGDRSPRLTLRRGSSTVAHRFRRGRFTVRVSATDKAGNAIAVTRRLTIKK